MSDKGTHAVGDAIIDALKSAQMSKSELARQTGRTWPTVHAWCTGKHRPSDEDMAVIAQVTGRSLVDLGGEDAKDQDPPYPAWAEFLQSNEYRMGEPWMIESLRILRVPIGMEPVLETYKRLMFAMPSIEGESDD